MKMTGKKRILLFTGFVLLLVAGSALILLGLKKAGSYRQAAELMEAGDQEGAYRIYKGLGSYKDTGERMEQMAKKDPVLPYRILSKGDLVTFGNYEQDNEKDNGKEAIEWMVLDRIDDELLLLSVNCLDCKTYNDKAFEPVTWEESQIRSWLNGDFYEEAFSSKEKKLILTLDHENPNQSALGTEGGKVSRDQVVLLSEMEAGIYMGDEMNQEILGKAEASPYAQAQGLHTDKNGMADWWLRSPGAYEYTAQFVEGSGKVYTAGAYVDIAYGVRPAIWLNLASGENQ